MTVEPLLENHRKEMARRMPVYVLFEPFEQAGFPPEVLAVVQREASALAELVLAEALPVNEEARRAAETVAGLGVPDTAAVLKAWREAIAAAHPSRPGMRLLFHRLGDLLRACPRAQLPDFLESLPRLAPVAQELGLKGFEQILADLSALAEPESGRRFLATVAAYGTTSGLNVVGISRLARDLVTRGQLGRLEEIAATIPPDRTFEHRDAARLIPSLAILAETCSSLGPDAGDRARELVLEVAKRNLSSAYALSRDLPDRLQRLPRESVLPYLADFHHAIQAVGLRVVGFGLNELPNLYGRFGIDRTREFMARLAAVAEAYGPTAGQWFFERRTAAAREILER